MLSSFVSSLAFVRSQTPQSSAPLSPTQPRLAYSSSFDCAQASHSDLGKHWRPSASPRLGLSGYEAGQILYSDYGIVCELAGKRSVTFALNPGNHGDHIQRLVLGINHLAQTYASSQPSENSVCSPFDDIKMILGPREAFFTSKRRVALKDSLGEISGELVCTYPPALPVLMLGEVITAKALDYLIMVKSEGAVIDGASDPSLSSIVVCNVQKFTSFPS